MTYERNRSSRRQPDILPVHVFLVLLVAAAVLLVLAALGTLAMGNMLGDILVETLPLIVPQATPGTINP